MALYSRTSRNVFRPRVLALLAWPWLCWCTAAMEIQSLRSRFRVAAVLVAAAAALVGFLTTIQLCQIGVLFSNTNHPFGHCATGAQSSCW